MEWDGKPFVIKIGYDDWHVECIVGCVDDLSNFAKQAWVAYASEHSSVKRREPMKIATWSGSAWWAVPPDTWHTRKYGEQDVVWPTEKNDFPKIWRFVLKSYCWGVGFAETLDFVSEIGQELKTKKFRIVRGGKNDS